MKILIIETNKEELAANKRIADGIVDTIVNFLDSFVKLTDYTENNNYSEKEDNEDGSNKN